MPLTYLLDTSVFSQPIKDHPDSRVLDVWEQLDQRSVCTSALSLAEMLRGLEVRKADRYWNRYREILKDAYQVLSFDKEAAAVFGATDAVMLKNGRPTPVVDLLIAATAMRHGLILVTLNTKDFEHIPGLQIEDWSR